MSIVPQSRLNPEDMAVLGNNILPSARSKAAQRLIYRRRQFQAINRSLANVGERVTALRRPLMVAS